MRVLVTGSEGYVGVHMVRVLAARGHTVTGLDAGFYSERDLYEAPGDGFAGATIRRDIRRIHADDLTGFDAVVHLADLFNDPFGDLKPEITYRINHEGTVRLAKLCRENGIARFVYASSCSVYGEGLNGPVDEDAAVNPRNSYAHCKVLAERDISKLACDGFSPTFMRNASVFGASPRMRFDVLLNNLAGQAWTRREIQLVSDGSLWRPLVHVLDLCDAFAAVLEARLDVVHDRVFNVGDNSQNHLVSDIARIVAQAFGGCRVSHGSSGTGGRSYRVDFSRIANELPGFQCRRSSHDGAVELARLFASIDLSADDFESRHFTRLAQLKHLLATGRLCGDLFWVAKNRAA